MQIPGAAVPGSAANHQVYEICGKAVERDFFKMS
jgi:hypothetical protein